MVSFLTLNNKCAALEASSGNVAHCNRLNGTKPPHPFRGPLEKLRGAFGELKNMSDPLYSQCFGLSILGYCRDVQGATWRTPWMRPRSTHKWGLILRTGKQWFLVSGDYSLMKTSEHAYHIHVPWSSCVCRCKKKEADRLPCGRLLSDDKKKKMRNSNGGKVGAGIPFLGPPAKWNADWNLPQVVGSWLTSHL